MNLAEALGFQADNPQIGQAVMGPDPMVQELMTPPANQAEVASRTAKWQQLLQDPRLQNALLTFAAIASGPLKFGQTPLNKGLMALAGGKTAWDLTERQMQEDESARAKEQAALRLQAAQTRGLEASAAQAEQKTRFEAEDRESYLKKQGLELARLEAEIERAQTDTERLRAAIKRERILSDIAEKTGLQAAEADIAARRAAAAASQASAAASSAHARLYGAQAGELETIRALEDRILRGETLSPQEMELVLRSRAAKGDPVSQKVAYSQWIRNQLKEAYPGLTEQEYSKKVLEFESQSKGEELKLLQLLLMSGDRALEEEAARRLRARLQPIAQPPGETKEDVRARLKIAIEQNKLSPQQAQAFFKKHYGEDL